jgi:hypothetical protein
MKFITPQWVISMAPTSAIFFFAFGGVLESFWDLQQARVENGQGKFVT